MIRFTQATTSWLDGPGGLSRLISPYLTLNRIGLSSGLQPWLGSVVSLTLSTNCLSSTHGVMACNELTSYAKYSSAAIKANHVPNSNSVGLRVQ